MRMLVPGLVLLLVVGAAAQNSKPTGAKPTHSTAPQTSSPPAVDPAEIDALKADVQRMSAILNQMRTNLGYVSTTTQPLRHQFDLEIDMWQTVIGQTERRIQKMEAQEKR